MAGSFRFIWVFLWSAALAAAPRAQEGPETLEFLTVERPPFAMRLQDGLTGFSIELMRALGQEIGRPVRFRMADSFPEMLAAVAESRADGAIANISITAERERLLDFSQPIFDSGIQIMTAKSRDGWGGLVSALLRPELAALIGISLFALWAAGMVMWLLERGKQPYFDRPARRAMFPAFWWALNLVVNGGFEERLPRSPLGRLFAVLLVVSSLFVVSLVVARITSEMTVQAINSSISGLADLDGKRIGTTRGSTAATFLQERQMDFIDYDDLAGLLDAFEAGELDAVVFDGPLLAYYIRTRGREKAELLPRVFKRESYGIALPSGSPLREDVNRALLALRERGAYDAIRARWFGAGN